MQQKRGESQKEQWNLGLWAVGALRVVKSDGETWWGWGRKPSPEQGLTPPFPVARGWLGGRAGTEGGKISILSSSAGRVMSPPTPCRVKGRGWPMGRGEGLGEMGREGHRVRGGPKWNPTHLPRPPKCPQSSGTKTGRGQSLPPNCEEDRAPRLGAQRVGAGGQGTGRQGREQGAGQWLRRGEEGMTT